MLPHAAGCTGSAQQGLVQAPLRLQALNGAPESAGDSLAVAYLRMQCSEAE